MRTVDFTTKLFLVNNLKKKVNWHSELSCLYCGVIVYRFDLMGEDLKDIILRPEMVKLLKKITQSFSSIYSKYTPADVINSFLFILKEFLDENDIIKLEKELLKLVPVDIPSLMALSYELEMADDEKDDYDDTLEDIKNELEALEEKLLGVR